MMVKPYWARVDGPLEPYAEGFRGELERLGFTPLSAAGHVRLVAHLSRWLARQGLSAAQLTPTVVDAYFAERRAAGYTNSLTGRSAAPLVGYLQQQGVLAPPEPAAPDTPVEVLLARYRAYLRTERGLAASTAELNARLVRPFLDGRVRADGELDWELGAAEVGAFVLAFARRWPRSAGRLVTALRSLLRFCHIDGVISRPLAAAVPPVASWKLAGLPGALPEGQAAALLATCDPRRPAGRRDFAILVLLSRLGLRAGEVAALGLDDIDWRRGELVVCGKGGRRDRLPLPADVGEAVVAYLRHGRPQAARGRTVFVAAQAPYGALTTAAVTTVVAVAARRAGLGRIHAHRLRHSAATAMLRSGASLAEIGEVLRHRTPATTAIYAKVDLGALRPLARPWPGGAA